MLPPRSSPMPTHTTPKREKETKKIFSRSSSRRKSTLNLTRKKDILLRPCCPPAYETASPRMSRGRFRIHDRVATSARMHALACPLPFRVRNHRAKLHLYFFCCRGGAHATSLNLPQQHRDERILSPYKCKKKSVYKTRF